MTTAEPRGARTPGREVEEEVVDAVVVENPTRRHLRFAAAAEDLTGRRLRLVVVAAMTSGREVDEERVCD